jgi:hypothetical protein
MLPHGPINTISCVETRRTFKDEMPKTGFILDVKCQVCDGAHYQIMSKLWPLTTWQTLNWNVSSLDVGKLKLKLLLMTELYSCWEISILKKLSSFLSFCAENFKNVYYFQINEKVSVMWSVIKVQSQLYIYFVIPYTQCLGDMEWVIVV